MAVTQVRNLELLKKRFGETALASCETMLRDIADSRRVTRAVQRHCGDEEAKVALKEQFEADKARVAKLRADRKFRPY